MGLNWPGDEEIAEMIERRRAHQDAPRPRLYRFRNDWLAPAIAVLLALIAVAMAAGLIPGIAAPAI